MLRSCADFEWITSVISSSLVRYETGDHVAVYPKNSEELVNKLGQLLNVDLDTVITLKNLDEDSSKRTPFPCPTSYRTALSYYVDITSPPRTHVLKELIEYTTNEEEKKLLKTMSSPSEEGKLLYSDWVIKSCRSIVHILEELPSAKPPLDHVLELLPRMQCRYYSISSSPKVYPDSIHVTAVLIEYETPTKRTNRGVATSWLKTKLPDNGEKVPIFVRRSQFKLPAKHQLPIIMIGPGTGHRARCCRIVSLILSRCVPGTGYAPFRGFIQERQYLKEQGKPVGDTILYFGCRKKAEDFLYQDELEAYIANGTITKAYFAFSRDQVIVA